jgi:hypothetical protein
MIIPTRTDDIVSSVLVGIIMTLIMFPLFLSKVSPYDSSDCIICCSGYNHRDINNVSSIFLVKSALMIPVIVSSLEQMIQSLES